MTPKSAKVLFFSSDEQYLNRTTALIAEAGFSVTCCHSLAKAMEHLRKDGVDIVVLDENIPEPGVWESCWRLRKVSLVPILITGPQAESAGVVRAINLGADFYLKRPFLEAELVARISAMVRRYRMSRPNPAGFEAHV